MQLRACCFSDPVVGEVTEHETDDGAEQGQGDGTELETADRDDTGLECAMADDSADSNAGNRYVCEVLLKNVALATIAKKITTGVSDHRQKQLALATIAKKKTGVSDHHQKTTGVCDHY